MVLYEMTPTSTTVIQSCGSFQLKLSGFDRTLPVLEAPTVLISTPSSTITLSDFFTSMRASVSSDVVADRALLCERENVRSLLLVKELMMLCLAVVNAMVFPAHMLKTKNKITALDLHDIAADCLS